MKAKPDCTGQQFGMLTVLGKGGKVERWRSGRGKTFRQLWRLQCNCGKIIEIPRGDFDKPSGQVSCGCKRARGLVDNKKRPVDITGQRFGNLVVIELSGQRNKFGRLAWIMQCDCGEICLRSLTDVKNSERAGVRNNCGNKHNHPERWLHYPPIPIPYPVEAGELLKEYLLLTKLRYKNIDSEVEDAMRDRLIRTAWIITYRRREGELISKAHERNLIQKNLRYSSLEVKHRRMLFKFAGRQPYNKGNNEIGSEMTDLTSTNYPAIDLQGKTCIPTKRLRFKRC